MGRKNSNSKAKQPTDFSYILEKKIEQSEVVKKENEG
jgi:hypothetical protein